MADPLTFSYDPRLARPLDRVRSAIQDRGDLDENGDPAELGQDGTPVVPLFWEFADETILATVQTYGFREGIAQLAEQLMLKYAKVPDEYDEDGGIKVSFKNLVKAYAAIAASFRSSDPEQLVNTPQPAAALGVIRTGAAAVAALRFGVTGPCTRPLDGRLPYGGRPC